MSNTKLDQIQALALAHNAALKSTVEYKGGCLLLGRHYAESDTIFFGLNPGLLRDAETYTFGVEPTTSKPFNSPFRNWPEDNRAVSYFRNCETKFLAPNPVLDKWFNDRITSSFLVPWRTRNVPELRRMNADSVDGVFRCSGDILRRMIEDHEARVLVVAGKEGPGLLNEILRAGGKWRDGGEIVDGHYDRGCFQYSEWQFQVDDRRLTVYQVPHFSRANSSERLRPCATWLIGKLGLQD